MTDYIFKDIGSNRIQAFAMPENIKSQKVLQKNGYNGEGLIRQGIFGKVKAFLV